VISSTLTAIIPARAGSKGVPNKNLLTLGDRSLVEIAIDCALESDCVGEVIVTSDSDEILDQAIRRGVVAHKRPGNLARDDSSMADAILNLASSNLLTSELAVLLQPTSPLRRPRMLAESLDLLLSSDAAAVYSMQNLDSKILKCWVQDSSEGHVHPAIKETNPFMNRQDLGETYLCDGLIFMFKVSEFVAGGGFPIKNVMKVTFDESLSIDIDSKEDFESARRYFK